jgi:hypothetical protein
VVADALSLELSEKFDAILSNPKCPDSIISNSKQISGSNVTVGSYSVYAFSTIHPSGTPSGPVTFHVAIAFLTNVPVEDTPDTQLYKQLDSDIFVASILI